ncbi:MAG: DUF433 domain-containing protein [Caldilineaceae bacterium]|nr:DUF433 domain-containing protein [Caldilineaceae bacterium]
MSLTAGDPIQLEDYFTFLAPNDIRIKGTRIGIETILFDYLELGLFAEQIAARYPGLSVEQIYATLTYYWRNQGQVDVYLNRIDKEIEGQRRQQQMNPSPGVKRLCELARQRDRQATLSV